MTHNLNIASNPEELSIDDAIMSSRDVEDGFIFTLTDIELNSSKLDEFIEKLADEFGNFEEFDYSRSKNNIYKKYNNSDLRIYVKGNSIDSFIGLYGRSEHITLTAWKIFNTMNPDKETIDVFFHSYFMNGQNVEDTTKIIKMQEFDTISEDYYPYIKTDIMFDQFFTGKENILLVVGDPGLGKSKLSSLMLKYAYNNTDKIPYDKLDANPGLDNQYISVGYVKSTDILSQDKFWRKLEQIQHDFIILDDLDYMLSKRDTEVRSNDEKTKNDFLNQFLSFTDGVTQQNTKFIITTNQSFSDIDTAVLRKGRLFDILELRNLDREEALNIWKKNKLKEQDFNNIFSKHDVLPAELGSEISKKKNSRIKSSTESYLLEEGISKTAKAARSKTISL